MCIFWSSSRQLTGYFNCHSFIKESIRPPSNILWIHPWVNPLSVVMPCHWADFETALFTTIKSGRSGGFFSKYVNDRLAVPVVINQRVALFNILVPNHTVWIARRVFIVVKTTGDDDTGTHQRFNVTWHINCPSPATTANASCNTNQLFLNFVIAVCLKALWIQMCTT